MDFGQTRYKRFRVELYVVNTKYYGCWIFSSLSNIEASLESSRSPVLHVQMQTFFTFHGKLRLKSFTCGLVPWYLTQSDNFWRLKIDSFSKPIAPLMLSRCLNLWDDMTHWDQTAVSFLVSSVRSGNLRFIYLSPWRAIYTASLYYAQLTELCKTAHF